MYCLSLLLYIYINHTDSDIFLRQALLVVVLLITIGINVLFILNTSRRLHEEMPSTGNNEVISASRESPFSACVSCGLHYDALNA
jgi:hypothetical protein